MPRATGPVGGYGTGVFHWSAVGGADHYEFEIAEDAAFNSPVLGSAGHFNTRSTIATLSKTLQDGKYWWRVRAVGASGSISAWRTKTFQKSWRQAPQLLSPADKASISFPSQPLLLQWSPVLGAASYEVTIAHDASLTSLVGGKPAETTTAAYVPPAALAEGTYFWAVTPVDAEKHMGARSAIRSFQWGWPSATQTSLRDLVAAPELFDPLLSWTAVPGAVHYELDVNFSQDFNTSSRVCCSSSIVATGYSPSKILPNNTYYWRVRPVNAQGEEGVWTTGTNFTKTFDNVPPVVGSSIGGLHMRDASGDSGPKPAGWATSSPILVWNPVPGASAYDLDVYDMQANGACDITRAKTHWHVVTPLTEWAPLGTGHKSAPYPASGASLQGDSTKLTPGTHYCVRIRAEGDAATSGGRIYGDYSYLNDAFSYSGSTPACSSGAASPSGSYITPTGGAQTGQTPLYTWRPISGAGSYWVLVSRDPSFTTLVDYAFTQIPAYAPRRTITDETTQYYWAILPAACPDGTGVTIDPVHASAANFQKRSAPPTLVSPTKGAELAATQPQFQWTAVQGARNYRVQVSTDPNFGRFLDNVVTPSTSYVSNTKYPAQATLYWRVQANDDGGTALTWSDTGTFKQVLPAPRPLTENAAGSSLAPTLRWSPVGGATSYDVQVERPGGSVSTYSHIPTPAMVLVKLSGTGVFRWQVRAEFAGSVAGPYSPRIAFTRTVTPPKGPQVTISGRTLLFHWQGRPGLKEYIVQVASRPDFSGGVDTEKTELTAVAPTLYQGGYAKGGKFYWHVAAVDADGNTGGYSPTRTFSFHGPTGKH